MGSRSNATPTDYERPCMAGWDYEDVLKPPDGLDFAAPVVLISKLQVPARSIRVLDTLRLFIKAFSPANVAPGKIR